MLVLLLSNRREGNSDSLLLGGVMVNAFCGAVIMFLISVSKTSQMQKIIFWLMGDLSSVGTDTLPLLLGVLPCFLLIFLLAQPLNLLLTGRESASSGLVADRVPDGELDGLSLRADRLCRSDSPPYPATGSGLGPSYPHPGLYFVWRLLSRALRSAGQKSAQSG
jgi:hypothetical protein